MKFVLLQIYYFCEIQLCKQRLLGVLTYVCISLICSVQMLQNIFSTIDSYGRNYGQRLSYWKHLYGDKICGLLMRGKFKLKKLASIARRLNTPPPFLLSFSNFLFILNYIVPSCLARHGPDDSETARQRFAEQIALCQPEVSSESGKLFLSAKHHSHNLRH